MDLILAKEAQKQYKKLPNATKEKIKRKLTALTENPYSGKKLEGMLKGRRSARVWPYRIIYVVNEKEKRIEISDILHRQGAYK